MNRLKDAASPYLRQHADNPVDWWPWGAEALEYARKTQRPILLSIGYASCHWCHVMAHESFEDEETAHLMNKWFVNIKVDREERPDVDQIYMAALHALGERGGWPLTMFLTSTARPFSGGTYFPPEPRYGRPSFKQVLEQMATLYANADPRIDENATAIVNAISPRNAAAPVDLPDALGAAVADHLIQNADRENGGTAGAPQVPQHRHPGIPVAQSARCQGADARPRPAHPPLHVPGRPLRPFARRFLPLQRR